MPAPDPSSLAATIAYEVTRGVIAAVLEHLPQINAEWAALHTTTAIEAEADPALTADLSAELGAAIASGKVPSP